MPPKTVKSARSANNYNNNNDESNNDEPVAWNLEAEVAHRIGEPNWAVKNVIEMLRDEYTIPFIARYRRERTNNMDGEKLRLLESVVDELVAVKNKVTSIVNILEKSGKMETELRRALAAVKTLSDAEHLYEPYKATSSRSYVNRAKELGLEPAALEVLRAPDVFEAAKWVKVGTKGLENLIEVETGIQHIVADKIAKDPETLDVLVNYICRGKTICLESSRAKEKKISVDEEAQSKKAKKTNKSLDKKPVPKKVNSDNFENYFQFNHPIHRVQPHQALGIFRGESVKALNVKIVIPNAVPQQFKTYCHQHWILSRGGCSAGARILREAIEDAYKRLVSKYLDRHFRSQLKQNADKAALYVFRDNLKQLLLGAPVRGRVVLGVDPGFAHGCKLAVVDPNGGVLETGVAFLDRAGDRFRDDNRLVATMIAKHRVTLVAIGNGTACRPTEKVISFLIRDFPDASYVIVDESGASIYSVTSEAAAEMPDLDPNLRSAASIARRLQDPLAEIVKIGPRHIGVGMYQHDIDEKKLKDALDKVVEDCVSFVGVDLNSASAALLTHVAGMNAARAKNVIKWRERNGSFVSREQLLLVTGFGPKSFEQSAGFLRINPKTARSIVLNNDEEPPAKKRKKAEPKAKPNPLDMTCIHPESYDVAKRLVDYSRLGFDKFLKEETRQKFQESFRKWSISVDREKVSKALEISQPTLDVLLRGMTQPLDFDLRVGQSEPVFRTNVLSMKDVRVGNQLTGRVNNVTPFGAFVDVGLEKAGLIPKSKCRQVALGDRVTVTVIQLDMARGRISLDLDESFNAQRVKLM